MKSCTKSVDVKAIEGFVVADHINLNKKKKKIQFDLLSIQIEWQDFEGAELYEYLSRDGF